MHFLRVGALGEEKPVLVMNDQAFDLTSLTSDLDGPFLERNGLATAHQAALDGKLPTINIDGQRIGAPVANPQAVLCIGQNYAAHAAESGSAPPKSPILFHKHPSTIVGPNDAVVVPHNAFKVDWEAELAVVIGKQARYLDSPVNSLEYIAGYTISNDVSERAFQLEESGGQWSKGKNCETFNPMGPILVPSSEISPDNLNVQSKVNGEIRQNSNTSDMIFSVAQIIHHLSQYMVLQPGDIINTGTPEGVALSGRFPYLTSGDEVTIEIEGLGIQKQAIVSL